MQSVQIEQATFNRYMIGKLHLIKGTLYLHSYRCEGGFTGCRFVRSVQIEEAAFNPYTVRKLHIIKVS